MLLHYCRWGAKFFGAVSYHDNRCLLEQTNCLRMFGQSLICCESNYFRNTNKIPIEDDDHSVKIITDCKKHTINKINPCDNDNADEIIAFLSNKEGKRQTNKGTTHHSYPYDIMDLKKYIYFHNLNYRPYQHYKRIDNATYKKYAQQSTTDDNHHNKEGHVQGVKGLWPFALLQYAKIDENISYDGFHVLMNIAKYTFKLMLNYREIKTKTREFCQMTNCHPDLWHNTASVNNKTTNKQNLTVTPGRWVIGGYLDQGVYKSQINANINSHLKSICMPKGYGDGYRVGDILDSFKTYKGMQVINFITSHMDYFCYAVEREDTNYPKEYLLYYSMLSSLFAQVQAPILIPNTVDELYFRGVEVVEVHGGMFPPSESVMIYHQLLDMIQFLKVAGPMRSWWSIPIERAMVGIKNKKTNGGNSFYKSMVEKEYADEYATMSMTYANESECFSSKQGSDAMHLRYDDDADELRYDFLKFHLIPGRAGTVDKIELNPFEKENLLSFLLEELELVFEENKLIDSCPTYRLFRTYKYHREDFTFVGSFYDWMVHMSKDNFLLCKALLKQNPDADYKAIYTLDINTLEYWTDSNMSIDHYVTALVWGTKFKGRGSMCSERDQHQIKTSYGSEKTVNVASNPSNILRNHYTENRGCWCKIHIPEDNYDNDNHNKTNRNLPKFTVAQINYFSCLHLPNDTLLTKLPFASVTARKPIKIRRKSYNMGSGSDAYENIFQVDGKDENLIEYESPFAMLYNIYATPLAYTAYASAKANNKVYSLPIGMKDNEGKQLDHLIMYALERQKECIHTQEDCRVKMHPYNNKQVAHRYYVNK